MAKSVDQQIRDRLWAYKKGSGYSWYKIAQEAGLSPIQNIYNFRDGNGANGENTIRLMRVLDMGVDDIELE